MPAVGAYSVISGDQDLFILSRFQGIATIGSATFLAQHRKLIVYSAS
jgi:hypothetical protein